MPEVEVKNVKNEVVGTVQLSEEIFGAVLNEPLIWEAVQHYLANQRSGTHSTKTRGEVRGSGKKLWRQKGTGRARIGSVRSPVWRHGGTVHGPKPRDYSYAFPKKKLRGAMKSALSSKLAESQVTVLEDFSIPQPKTKEVKAVLKNFTLPGKLLIVDAGDQKNFYLGARNIPNVEYVRSGQLNIYEVVRSDSIFITKAALLRLQEVLSR
jgi:large subunit ribosomal protein L4